MKSHQSLLVHVVRTGAPSSSPSALAFVLTVIVCGFAVTMMAMSVLNGIGDAVAFALAGIGRQFVFVVLAVVLAALLMIPWLLELLSLLPLDS